MILGIGIDIVHVERIESAVTRGRERLLDRIFTRAEQEEAGSGPGLYERLAARFAAKEALFKALGTGWSGGIAWRDAEVRSEPSGRPELSLSGRARQVASGMGVTRSHLSLSHEGGIAAAVVVLEGQG